jgi:hypothetical protein
VSETIIVVVMSLVVRKRKPKVMHNVSDMQINNIWNNLFNNLQANFRFAQLNLLVLQTLLTAHSHFARNTWTYIPALKLNYLHQYIFAVRIRLSPDSASLSHWWRASPDNSLFHSLHRLSQLFFVFVYSIEDSRINVLIILQHLHLFILLYHLTCH